jgi:hypothetical protein
MKCSGHVDLVCAACAANHSSTAAGCCGTLPRTAKTAAIQQRPPWVAPPGVQGEASEDRYQATNTIDNETQATAMGRSSAQWHTLSLLPRKIVQLAQHWHCMM